MQQQNATPFQSPSSQGLSEPFDNPFDAIRAIATRQDLERNWLLKNRHPLPQTIKPRAAIRPPGLFS